jgi:hypothetical protein
VGIGPARSSAASTSPAEKIRARPRGLFEHGTDAHTGRPATEVSPFATTRRRDDADDADDADTT